MFAEFEQNSRLESGSVLMMMTRGRERMNDDGDGGVSSECAVVPVGY